MTKLSLGGDILLEVTKLEDGGIDILIDDVVEPGSQTVVQLDEQEVKELINFLLLTITLEVQSH